MSRSKKYLIVFVSIILLLTAVYNIQFEYLKYYDGIWYYVPTDGEKELIVYMGERDYECEFYFYVDDFDFTRYDVLDDEATIYCNKEMDGNENVSETVEIDGNIYDVKNTIRINIVDGKYYISMFFSVDFKEIESNKEILDYSRYYSPYYENIGTEIYTEDRISLFINGVSCIVRDSNASIVVEYLLNTKEIIDDGDIYIREPENDDEDSVEENVALCNETLDAGYGEAMYYDVIEPLEKEMSDIKRYSEKVLN